MEPIPAVVTPLDDHMGIDIARSLGRRGIPVYGIDIRSDTSEPGIHSKYITFVESPDPEKDHGAAYIQFLINFGKDLGKKAVLYGLSDYHVLLISKHRKELQPYYEFVMPDPLTIEMLASKDGLQSIAEQVGIPAPKAFNNFAPGEIESIARQMVYPAILKPKESTYWHTPEITHLLRRGLTSARAKVILCHSAEELIRNYRLIAQYDDRVIIQEVIPGEDSRLVYFCFYLNRQSAPLGIFAGRKHRVIPTGFGSASFVRSLADPELVAVSLRLLSATRYQGLGGIEFKKDPRDDCYKLIEFNTRFGMWDGLSPRCGVDLPYIAYQDALHQPVEPSLTYREGVIWIDWQRDLRAVLSYMQNHQMSFAQWLASLRGEKMWAIYSRDDWRPGLYFTWILFRKMAERIGSRFGRRSQ